MNILKRIYLGWKRIGKVILENISLNVSDLIWLIPLILATIFIGIFVQSIIKEKIRKRKYLINKHHIRFTKKLKDYMLKYHYLKKLIDIMALKICIFNDRSFEINREYSSVVVILSTIFTIFNIIFLIPSSSILWYHIIFFSIFIVIFLVLVFYIINTIIKLNFTKQLPRTFKLLNSRFSRKGDILEAIDISLEDFDRAIARELTRVSEVLIKNDDDKIEEEFEMIDRIYNNEYFTVLLNLIKQAYYKPGNESIKKIFSNTTSNILLELQMQKKLSLANIWYILLSFLVPYGIIKVEEFNLNTLGEETFGFYSSPTGIGLKVLIYLAMFAYILGLLLLKRTA